ncbi:hypothetical protein GR183_05530 [Stappia sp. GBMRC 2046]|uniref:Membrane-anchored protein n=1 Tax=Stappia sediminis TaxID=2692190 RepID=A0A7X3LSM1_9HYPH|nr:hypothetical protein [Stappia sediminis]MXN64357.1 hypothetical protein [Stappia sediminis]
MSVAKAEPAQTSPRETGAREGTKIQGRIDAFEDGRLYGWAWDAVHPESRMTIQVFLDGRRLVTTVADTPRVDLRRNGIGDGAYAFDLELPQEAKASPDGLSVVAVSPLDGSKQALRQPEAGERAAEAAIALPLARVMEKLDRLLAAQRQIAVGQRDATALLKDTTSRLDTLASTDGELGEALALLRGGQGDLSQRVQDLEVFLVRFDTTLKAFEDRLADLADRRSGGAPLHFMLLATLVGAVVGMIGAMIAGF